MIHSRRLIDKGGLCVNLPHIGILSAMRKNEPIMNVMQSFPYQVPALLDGKPKCMLIGGKWVEAMPPTVFADVRDEMSIARDEIFGPVLSAIPFDGIDELIRRANSTRFGLGSGVWTRDVRQGASRGEGNSRRHGMGQLLRRHGRGGAVRWLQDERLWS